MKNDIRVSCQVLADMLDVDERTVQRLAKQGTIPKAKRNEYPLRECIRSYTRYLKGQNDGPPDSDVEVERAKARAELAWTQEKARKEALANDVSAGHLIPVESLEPFLQGVFVNFRQQLLTLSIRIVPEIMCEPREPEAVAILQDSLEMTLKEFSNATLDFTEDGEESSDSGLMDSPSQESGSSPTDDSE